MTRRAALLLTSLAIPLGSPVLARADTVGTVGSSNVADIEPPVPHPDETPCVVTLFSGASFGAATVPFTYAPPAGCSGPWAKVVLATDVSVTAGRQFDRTASIFIGGVNVLFGTTAEPRAALAPSWHVERDVTDDTALLEASQAGHVLIANYQSSVYTSTITASSTLLFYPATAQYPAPRTPDLVIPLNADPAADTVALNDGTQTLSRTGILPTNVERARLDVLLQSQGNDEFWYTCVPDALATALESCGGGAFREGQVSIDGVRAGVAPVYPWIYTGGIDPYLWEPIPGVQTLAFKPYSVELTPFVGAIDDGKPHTVSLSVAGANDYFSVTGTLYLTLDHGSATVHGAVTRNTLAAPSPVVTNTIVTDAAGDSTGTVLTTSTHDYGISGYAVTSHGVVQTSVDQVGRFSNAQVFDVTDLLDDQTITQRTDTATTVTTRSAAGVDTATRVLSYPLVVRYDYTANADGSAVQDTAVNQAFIRDTLDTHNLQPVAASRLVERIIPTDTLDLSAAGAVTAHSGSGTALYASANSLTGCITRTATSTNSVLTAQSDGTQCDLQALLP